MGRLTREFAFSASVEGWTFNAGGGSGLVGSRVADEGGVLQVRRSGRNQNNGAPFWEWAGTWEDLGVPPGKWVTGVIADYQWRCSEASTPATGNNASLIGPLELLDAGSAVRHTFSSEVPGITTVTQLAERLGAKVDRWIDLGSGPVGMNDPSDTAIRLRLAINPRTANNPNAAVTLRLAELGLVVLYEDAPLMLATLAGWRVWFADFTTMQSTTHTLQQVQNYATSTSKVVIGMLYFQEEYAPGKPYREIIYGNDFIYVDGGTWGGTDIPSRIKPSAIVLEGQLLPDEEFDAILHDAMDVALTL